MNGQHPTVVAVDTGGTFTDFVVLRPTGLRVYKRPSTPADPSGAVLAGLGELLSPGETFVLAHGSTVATNALLERRGARVAWITNRGFEDLIEIGRQARPQLYALVGTRPPPLVEPERRIGISGRVLKDGTVESTLEAAELASLAERVEGAESIAVGFLHSYANPEHEDAVAAALGELEVPVTCSARLLPEYREYERFSTALVNAYIGPLVQRYLRSLDRATGAERVRVMASGGGAFSLERAAREPVHTILSGPAGGVVAALDAARRLGFERILSFDMGGTSTDVSLCPGRPLITKEYEIAGQAVAIPVIDIHTVGAGGGSIARRDAGGALKVGPQSAGAVPGPICYGNGGVEVTVTDAHVWLGRIPPNAFLGGRQVLDRAAVETPLSSLADQLGLAPIELAHGILEVANTRMEGALRLISVERGHDPADLALVAFGGAAPLHAAELAERLGIPRVVVPLDPGILSARGILVADVRKDASRSMLLRGSEADFAVLRPAFDELERQAREELATEGFSGGAVSVDWSIDARYFGQSYELNVSATSAWISAFHAAHRQRFGFARADAEAEVVTLRVSARAALRLSPTVDLERAADPAAPDAVASVFHDGCWAEVPVFGRSSLRARHTLSGPAVISEYSATTWVPADWQVEVAERGELIMTPEGSV
ncbi:MAG: hydantoinase/oxoprolinase family protein [Gemmatimonadota bacterium]|nr:MAG: hydantoinase/oxoprolinase family protein [Gemmatimonadota bacterium]